MAYRKPKKRIMRSFKINEISAVDRPAQEGARMVLMKRADESETDPGFEYIEKEALLLSDADGHSHLIMDAYAEAGHTSYETASGAEYGHSHPWVRMPDGSIAVGMASGHGHDIRETSKMVFTDEEVEDLCGEDVEKAQFSAEQRRRLAATGVAMRDGSFPIRNRADLRNAIQAFGRAGDKAAVARHIKRRAEALGAASMLPTEGRLANLLGKVNNEPFSDAAGDGGGDSPEENGMSKDNQAADGNEAVKRLEGELEIAKAYGELTDAEKVFYNGIEDEAEKGAFLGSSAAKRKEIIDRAAEAKKRAETVVYETSDGLVFTKADDPRLVAMAKRTDAAVSEAETLRKQLGDQAIEKRAREEFPYLSGSLKTRVAIIKSVERIEDEDERKEAFAALKAQNDDIAKALKTYGHKGRTAGQTVNPEADVDGGNAEDRLNEAVKAFQIEKKLSDFPTAMSEFTKTAEGRELYAEFTEEFEDATRH